MLARRRAYAPAMASVFTPLQLVAFLFMANGDVGVAAEGVNEIAVLQQSADVGAAAYEIESKLPPFIDRSREQFFCVGVTEGGSLQGELFPQLWAAPVRRFMMANDALASYAERTGRDPSDSRTLLLACREACA